MKKVLFIFIFLTPVYLFAQGLYDQVIYLDSIYTKATDKNFQYFKVIRDYYVSQKDYTIELYYKSGKLKTTGVSQDKDYSRYNGYWSSFYENGTLEKRVLYKDGIPVSTYKSWYENGKKRDEGLYIANILHPSNDPILRISQYWDENDTQRVTNGEGIYLEQSGSLSLSGTLKNGLKEGTWIGKHDNYRLTFTEIYEDGILISGISKDKDGIERSYSELNVRPSPKKGMKHFYKFVGNKFFINERVIKTEKIILTFIVDKNGMIDNIEVLKGINPKLDKEAVRVVNLYSDWQPGQFRGINVKVLYTLPLKIEAD